jgi:predicted DsbA family dithiol-disulfide isomerase
MRADIFVDVVCPWCFIGKRRFERALEMRPDLSLQKAWRPFQLNPDMPAEGMPAAEFFAAKFGSAAIVAERRKTVIGIGSAVGIDFAFDRIVRQPNTLDAHRLVRYALKKGRSDAMVGALFTAHFVAGRDIGDRTVLAAIAGEIGLDAREAEVFLNSGDETANILGEDQEARRIGITAVPCYIIDRKFAVAGAQEPEFFLQVFDRALSGIAQPAK